MSVPCGQCIGCRLERSRQWAIRCVHEAQMHEENCFITLTYDEGNLPENYSLTLRHFQLFCKKLRKRIGRFRFFHAGEYGSTTIRPHYHACVFGYRPTDLKLYKVTPQGHHLYTSPLIDETWGLGKCWIGEVSFDSAAYVARYIVKKINGEMAEEHYQGRKPEYTTMSRRPGIAHDHFIKHHKAIYANDHVIMNNIKIKPPKYYDNQFEIINPKGLERIKKKRIKNAKKYLTNNSNERLIIREHCVKLKIKKLIKKL